MASCAVKTFFTICLLLTKPVCEGLIHNGINSFVLFVMALTISLYMVFKIDKGRQFVISAKVPFLGIRDKLLKDTKVPKDPCAKIVLV